MARTANPYAAEIGAECLKLLRAPEFIIPSLALPVLFYAMFGMIIPGSNQNAPYLLATYGVFTVMAPALFGFGAGVAQERERGWLKLKRAVPAPAFGYITAKAAATLLVAAAGLAMVYAVAGFLAGVELTRTQWTLMLGVHIVSALPFVFAGLTLGFLLGANGAVAAANLLFLALALLGGLWIPIVVFPDIMQQIAWAFPSFHLAEVALAASGAGGDRPVGLHLAVLGAMTGGLALTATLAWLRQR
ncbi:MAG: ABC transporter permease [Alphaproteobacteria bacterium]|nr:ABC transporter permease [Alphaproteobacteria bacterium]